MAIAKTMHGARAQVMIGDRIVGIFNSCSYGVQYDANPIYVLGRFNAAEIALTGMEPVSVQCSGFRVVDEGPYDISSVPKLQDLLNHEDIVLAVFDRQSKKNIVTVVGVRPTGYTTDVAARGLQSLNVTFMGIALGDESDDAAGTGAQDDTESATKY